MTARYIVILSEAVRKMPSPGWLREKSVAGLDVEWDNGDRYYTTFTDIRI